jgi:hypothetical protein
MKNVKITEKEGRVIEIGDISSGELRELVGLNGNGHRPPSAKISPESQLSFQTDNKPDFAKFKRELSDHAKRFIVVLSQNPGGVSADSLAEKLGFKSTNQIGGVAGGGLSKLAKRFHIDLDDIYIKEVTREDGERLVIYRPGPEIDKVL